MDLKANANQSDSDTDEFYDAHDEPKENVRKDRETTQLNDLSKSDDESKTELHVTNKPFNIPLHEQLNKACDIDDENDDSQSTIAKQEPIDDLTYIDEELLKNQEEHLTDEEKQMRHKQSLELKTIGNACFKEANYHSAIETYTNALKLCPLHESKDRSILYSNRSVCFLKLLDTDKCIKDCSKSIELDPTYTKPLLRRAECHENGERLDEALADYKQLKELEPKVYSHFVKCSKLEGMINERNEKMKTEMIGKIFALFFVGTIIGFFFYW